MRVHALIQPKENIAWELLVIQIMSVLVVFALMIPVKNTQKNVIMKELDGSAMVILVQAL